MDASDDDLATRFREYQERPPRSREDWKEAHGLCVALLSRYQSAGEAEPEADLQRAGQIASAGGAVRDDFIRANFKTPLVIITLQRTRHESDSHRRTAVRRIARQYCDEQLSVGSKGSFELVLEVASLWAEHARGVKAWEEAAEAHAYAAKALGRLVRASDRPERIELLAARPRLAGDHAHALWRGGRREDAVRLLEEAQSLVLRPRAFNRALSDLERVGHVAEVHEYRESAAEAIRLREELGRETNADRRDAIRREEVAARTRTDQAVGALRRLPGGERLFTQVTWEDVQAAATSAPIAYITFTSHGYDLITVRLGHPPALIPIEVGRSIDAMIFGWLKADNAQTADADDLLDELLAELSGPLISPLRDELRSETAVRIIVSGPLRAVPLQAVPVTDGQAGRAPRRLIDDLEVSYLASACSLGSSTAREVVPTLRLVGVADPLPRHEDLPPLTAAQPELEAVARWFPTPQPLLLCGENATLEKVTAALQDVDVLHAATHATVYPGTHGAAGLILAGGKMLAIGDVEAGPSLNLRLAVLSACWTASAHPGLVDQAVTLPQALIECGVRGVIAARSYVGDDSTAFLMARFHDLWSRDRSRPGAALREAQLWLRDVTIDELRRARAHYFGEESAVELPDYATQGRQPFAHPVHWAFAAHYGF